MPREARDTMSLRSEFVLPAFSTVHNLMARNGLLPGLVAAARRRAASNTPNQLWQMDFKGHFPLAVDAAIR
ncbi:hypothetical protein ECZU34_23510 [Escherichia coli]|nr:hypothetical protein ECZU17_17120 [Escherichia coli]GHL74603.1 hypothetical protein ECZU34_23510 [Escherichia coli]